MDPLTDVARAAHVREGAEAVRRVLLSIARAERLSTRKAARQARLPVPVTAAVLRELERRGLILRGNGSALSEAGLAYAREALGLAAYWDCTCTACGGRKVVIPPELEPVLAELRELCAGRPTVDWALDQSHGTPVTALRRALLLHENGDLVGRRIAFLGDDDLTSVAAALLLRRAGAVGKQAALTVLECDRRLVEYLRSTSQRTGVPLRVEHHDLLWPLPVGVRQGHDVAICDPPYTVPGLRLFVSRAIEALLREPGKRVYLCFAQKAPPEALTAQAWLAERGLLLREVMPGFNRYLGASIHANQSDMLVLETTEHTAPDPEADGLGAIYTYSRRTRNSRYRCRSCGGEHEVGPDRDHLTVQDLKRAGCPQCGAERFDRIPAKRR